MYTMAEQWEKADNCARIYRKSLLYLLYYGLETARRTDILGLEECVRQNGELRRIFGLDGTSGTGDVVWSVTGANQGRFASQSEGHGGFDDDPVTMNSVLRRILGSPDSASIHAYQGQERGRGVDIWSGPARAPKPKDPAGEKPPVRPRPSSQPPAPSRPSPQTPVPSRPSPQTAVPSQPPHTAGTGARRALCVGINYAGSRAELKGCINDMNEWVTELTALHFEVTPLVEQNATYDRMRQALGELVDRAKPGDRLVFQYAGHGTQVPDLNRDEPDGRDEAFVPWDWETGHFLIDDEIQEITSRLADGASLTFFVDCCHSGTIARAAALEAEPGADERIRYLHLDAGVVKRFVELRKGEADARAAVVPAKDDDPIAITFAACQDEQSAYEKDGRGDFTRNTVPLLRTAAGSVTNEDFFTLAMKPFAGSQRQTPNLFCSKAARTTLLLG